MTDIEKKALALVQEVQGFDCGVSIYHVHNAKLLRQALCRAIEQHEAFRQEVSDAVVAAKAYYEVPMYDLSAFIIAKPDPLVEAVAECDDAKWETGAEYVACLRAAIEARGGKIVWGEG